MLALYEKLGGKIIDTAYNYGPAQRIIGEYGWKGQIITKIWKPQEFEESLKKLKVDKVYCCMAREDNSTLIQFLKDMRSQGLVEKVGMSIYFPKELRTDVNVIQIPCQFELWKEHLKTMRVYSKVLMRSVYKLNCEREAQEKRDLIDDYVMGVSTQDQLIENMAVFG